MYWDVALWSAGIWAILSLAKGQLTELEKSTIVDMHNKLRSQVQPSAAFMQKVVWDETLRVVAEAYAAKCIWKHNPDLEKLFLGENLFVSTGPFNATKATVSWFEENVDYNFENKSCPKDKMCGHYTQMVWADTSRIGCATHFCDTLEGLDFKKATLLVCNYSPPGNFKGRNPYVSGEPCSKCPENLPVCEEKICVITVDPTVLPELSYWTTEPGVTEDPTVLPELSYWTTEPGVTEDPTVLPELSYWTTEPGVTEDPTVLPELSYWTTEPGVTEDPTVLPELSYWTTEPGVTEDPTVLPELSYWTTEPGVTEDPTVLPELSYWTTGPGVTEDPTVLPELSYWTTEPGVTEDPTALPELSQSTTKPINVPREPTHVSVKVDETGKEKTTKSHGSKMERVSSHLLMLIGIVLVL